MTERESLIRPMLLATPGFFLADGLVACRGAAECVAVVALFSPGRFGTAADGCWFDGAYSGWVYAFVSAYTGF